MSAQSRGHGHLPFPTALRWRLIEIVARAVPLAPSFWRGAVPALGTLGWLVAPGARRAVLDNLAHLLPDATPRERLALSRQVFRSVVRHYVWFFSLPVTTPEALDAGSRVDGYQHFLTAKARGRGVIVVGIHQGPAETMLQAFASRGVTCTAMVERLQPRQLDALFGAIRERWGHRFVAAGLAGTRALISTLRAGGVAALLIDRDVLGTGDVVELLGAPYRAPAGLIELALITGAAIVPAHVHWRRDGSFHVTLMQAFEITAQRRDRDAIERDLERLLHLLMPHLQAHPGQWLVLQRLWQDRSPAAGSYTGAHNGPRDDIP